MCVGSWSSSKRPTIVAQRAAAANNPHAAWPCLFERRGEGRRSGLPSRPVADATPRLTIDYTNMMAAGVADCGLSESDLDRWAGPAASAAAETAERRRRGDIGFPRSAGRPPSGPRGARLRRRARARDRHHGGARHRRLQPGAARALLGAGPPARRAAHARARACRAACCSPTTPTPPLSRPCSSCARPSARCGTWSPSPAPPPRPRRSSWSCSSTSSRALGAEVARARVVVTTDPSKGPLRRLADRLGLTAFPIPPSVGGRFSVLSPVGLLPAAVAGLDVVGLLTGARGHARSRARCRTCARTRPCSWPPRCVCHHVDRGDRWWS